tara:strand:- start:329 stop:529 length:201 start_codon:yes stop_codon:yes gene_type:complete
MFELHRNSDTGTKLKYVDDDDAVLSFTTVAEALVFTSGRPDFIKMSEEEATDVLNNSFKHYVTSIQ